ncbi:MAG: hypothetical protein EOP09_03090 [Proteobacteria bacterium]|nr:MAG: hypothetical protein EOP09_03090 [Pseudomonadota bacterium]
MSTMIKIVLSVFAFTFITVDTWSQNKAEIPLMRLEPRSVNEIQIGATYTMAAFVSAIRLALDSSSFEAARLLLVENAGITRAFYFDATKSAIESLPKDRNREKRFLVDQLLPEIESSYRSALLRSVSQDLDSSAQRLLNLLIQN